MSTCLPKCFSLMPRPFTWIVHVILPPTTVKAAGPSCFAGVERCVPGVVGPFVKLNAALFGFAFGIADDGADGTAAERC